MTPKHLFFLLGAALVWSSGPAAWAQEAAPAAEAEPAPPPAASEEDQRLSKALSRCWTLLDAGQYEEVIRFAESTLPDFEKEAKEEAAAMRGFMKKGNENVPHKANVAGTIKYVQARAYGGLKQREPHLATLKEVWTDYPFVQAWNVKGWFYKPGQLAKKETYIAILTDAVRGRSLKESPFPTQEDALDHPQMRHAVEECARTLLTNGDYEGLEYFGRRIQELPLRFPNGEWALYWFIRSVSGAEGPVKEEASWERRREKLAAWRKAAPDSIFAQLAEAERLVRLGWQARGSGFAHTVKIEAWPVFERCLAEAKAVLEKCPRTSPAWYKQILTISRADGTPQREMIELFNEGWKTFPGYRQTLDAIIFTLLPRWGGKQGQWNRFALDLAAKDGAKFYTLAVNEAWKFERKEVLDVPGFDKKLYHQGWLELLDEHPGSLALANQAISFAFSVDDMPLAAEAHRRVGERSHPAYWKTHEDFLYNKKIVARKLAEETPLE